MKTTRISLTTVTKRESEDNMKIDLSEELIKTIYKALKGEKNALQSMLIRVEVGTVAKEMKEIYEKDLEEVNDALQIFEDLNK